MANDFNLEYMFQHFLAETRTTHADEVCKSHLRNAYFSACGMMLMVLRNDISRLDPDQGAQAMQDMMDQVQEFKLKYNNKLN